MADPVAQYMSPAQLEKAINEATDKMIKCAQKMEFTQAAYYRDEVFRLQACLANKEKKQET